MSRILFQRRLRTRLWTCLCMVYRQSNLKRFPRNFHLNLRTSNFQSSHLSTTASRRIGQRTKPFESSRHGVRDAYIDSAKDHGYRTTFHWLVRPNLCSRWRRGRETGQRCGTSDLAAMGMSLSPYFSEEKTFDGVAGGPDVWISPYVKQHICPGKGGRRVFFTDSFLQCMFKKAAYDVTLAKSSVAREKAKVGTRKASSPERSTRMLRPRRPKSLPYNPDERQRKSERLGLQELAKSWLRDGERNVEYSL